MSNRSLGREVHIYDANNPAPELGVSFSPTDVAGALKGVPRDEQALQPGNYYILTDGSITPTNELWLIRTISAASGTCTDGVREQDGRCVITGEEAANSVGTWTGFQAAHVFPLAHEGHWKENDYSRWVTTPPTTESAGSISSVQNGMLLRADSHALLDSYEVAINPADNYKIVCFNTDRKGIAGKYLDQQLPEDPR